MAQHSGFFVGPAASELVSVLLAFDAALNAIRQGPPASAFVIKNDNQNAVDWVNGKDPSSQAGLKAVALVTLARRRLLLLRQLARPSTVEVRKVASELNAAHPVALCHLRAGARVGLQRCACRTGRSRRRCVRWRRMRRG